MISSSGHWLDNANGDELIISEIQPTLNTNSVSVTGGNDSGNGRALVAVAVCAG